MLKPLGRALAEWSPAERDAGDPLVRATAAWAEVVGADVARHSQPIQISGDTLVVATRSSAWSEQLSFLAERILASFREQFGLGSLRRVRFRVGTLSRRATVRVVRGAVRTPRVAARVWRGDAESAQDALARFRAAVSRMQRAKTDAGWKQCSRCAGLVPPGELAMCIACTIAAAQERERLVARLLFEVPWLGFSGIAALVADLRRDEYEGIRSRLLARWWEILVRAARAGRAGTRRERLVASSYVIVKSGLEPECVSPATVRSVLGDEIFKLLYEVRE